MCEGNGSHFLSTSRLIIVGSYPKLWNICTRVVLNKCSVFYATQFDVISDDLVAQMSSNWVNRIHMHLPNLAVEATCA